MKLIPLFESSDEKPTKHSKAFAKYLKSDNVVKVAGGYVEQTTQYSKVFTEDELYKFFVKEYMAKEAKSEPTEFDNYFIVYAQAGRFNGWAIVNATSKVEARRIMRNSNWLDTGRVTEVETFKEYCKNMETTMEEEKTDLGDDWPKEQGKWHEIEWGT